MATLQASLFTRAQTLARIRPALLWRFLERFRDYFEHCGLGWGGAPDTDEISRILMNPGPETPRGLTEALFCIKEMAVPAAEDILMDEARQRGISPEEGLTRMELALRLWLEDPESLMGRHAELAMLRVRSFEYFSSIEDDEPNEPTERTLRSLEHALDIFFQERGQGPGTRVQVYPRLNEIWFLICHGELYRREATLENGERGSVTFRPQTYDLVVYNQLTKELGINARTEKLRSEYRKQFGYYLFGRDHYFGGAGKYSLEPLREMGEAALNVTDVPGLQWVRLTEIQYTEKKVVEELTVRKAVNLFENFRYAENGISEKWNLKRASFRIRFDDNPTPRTVTLKPTNVALYSRDEDAVVVEEWLGRRGFIEKGQTYGSKQNEFRFSVY